MRWLSEAQWNCYFELAERLDQASPEQRHTILQTLTEDEENDVLSLLRLRQGLTPDPDRDRSGERIAHFILKEKIGWGGMGVVYRAVQAFTDSIERDVAIKLIHPALILNNPSEARARFCLEMENLIKLEHRNIARIYAGGVHRAPETEEETPFMAMELVTGQSLNKYAQANSAQLGTAGLLELFIRLCDALEHAHRQGIIHRDLKPGNILVDNQGEPRIIDFGLAQPHATGIAQPWPDCVSGTPRYMSPEQASGKRVTPASDIYTLGVILYELLSGRPPNPALSTEPSADIIAQTIVGQASEAPCRLLPGCSDALGKTIAKALAKDPTERYSSVTELKSDLFECFLAEKLRKHYSQHEWQALIG